MVTLDVCLILNFEGLANIYKNKFSFNLNSTLDIEYLDVVGFADFILNVAVIQYKIPNKVVCVNICSM